MLLGLKNKSQELKVDIAIMLQYFSQELIIVYARLSLGVAVGVERNGVGWVRKAVTKVQE